MFELNSKSLVSKVLWVGQLPPPMEFEQLCKIIDEYIITEFIDIDNRLVFPLVSDVESATKKSDFFFCNILLCFAPSTLDCALEFF